MVSWGKDAGRQGRTRRPPNVLECAGCGKRSLSAAGWRGMRVDLPDEGDEPGLAFYCPDCARDEFGD